MLLVAKRAAVRCSVGARRDDTLSAVPRQCIAGGGPLHQCLASGRMVSRRVLPAHRRHIPAREHPVGLEASRSIAGRAGPASRGPGPVASLHRQQQRCPAAEGERHDQGRVERIVGASERGRAVGLGEPGLPAIADRPQHEDPEPDPKTPPREGRSWTEAGPRQQHAEPHAGSSDGGARQSAAASVPPNLRSPAAFVPCLRALAAACVGLVEILRAVRYTRLDASRMSCNLHVGAARGVRPRGEPCSGH